MRTIRKILILFLCLNALVIKSRAQNLIDGDQSKDDLAEMLPSLENLIDSALKNNPYVQFRDLQVIVNECKLRANQTLWSRNLGFQADVRRGTFNNFSTNTSEGQTPDLFATKSNQTNYGLGAYIKFPLQDLFNRKNEIKLARTELEQARSMALEQRTEVRQIVIKQYNDLILKYKLLRIRMRFLETANANAQMAEKEFKNGIVNITEFSRISEITSRAESDFETARTEFVTAYLILEEIVGVKFNIIEK